MQVNPEDKKAGELALPSHMPCGCRHERKMPFPIHSLLPAACERTGPMHVGVVGQFLTLTDYDTQENRLFSLSGQHTELNQALNVQVSRS